MNNSYFYYINSDVLNIIITYLDYNDVKFIIDHENLIDFHDLFILKFKDYYRPNVKDYNIKQVYLGFLALDCYIDLKLFFMYKKHYVDKSIEDNIETHKYLICDRRSLPSNQRLRRLQFFNKN